MPPKSTLVSGGLLLLIISTSHTSLADTIASTRDDDFVANHGMLPGINITITAPPVIGFPVGDNTVAYYSEISLPAYSISTITVDFGTTGGGGSSAPNSTTAPPANFAIVQLHGCFHRLSLSYTPTLLYGQHQNGTNLGLLVRPPPAKSGKPGKSTASQSTTTTTLYVHNRNYHTAVEASVVLIAYDQRAPQPGACSMELSMAEVPSLQVSDDSEGVNDRTPALLVAVDTPLAADEFGQCTGGTTAIVRVVKSDGRRIGKIVNATVSAKTSQQQQPLRQQLVYTYYQRYLPAAAAISLGSAPDASCRGYFDGIRSMLTLDDVLANGQPAVAHPDKPQRRTYARLPGMAVVFASVVSVVVVEEQQQHQPGSVPNADDERSTFGTIVATAVYVPAYTMFCSPVYWRTDCRPFATPAYGLLALALLAVGVARGWAHPLYPAHAAAACDAFVVGSLAAYLTEPLWWPNDWWWDEGDVRMELVFLLCVACGAALATVVSTVAAVWLPANKFAGEVVTHILVGMIVAAFVTDWLDTAEMKGSWWWYHFVFGAAVATVMVAAPCCRPVWSGRLASAAWGTFGVVLAVTVWSGGRVVGTHTMWMVLNVMRSFRVPEFR